jgi:hypothetical protein
MEAADAAPMLRALCVLESKEQESNKYERRIEIGAITVIPRNIKRG